MTGDYLWSSCSSESNFKNSIFSMEEFPLIEKKQNDKICCGFKDDEYVLLDLDGEEQRKRRSSTKYEKLFFFQPQSIIEQRKIIDSQLDNEIEDEENDNAYYKIYCSITPKKKCKNRVISDKKNKKLHRKHQKKEAYLSLTQQRKNLDENLLYCSENKESDSKELSKEKNPKFNQNNSFNHVTLDLYSDDFDNLYFDEPFTPDTLSTPSTPDYYCPPFNFLEDDLDEFKYQSNEEEDLSHLCSIDRKLYLSRKEQDMYSDDLDDMNYEVYFETMDDETNLNYDKLVETKFNRNYVPKWKISKPKTKSQKIRENEQKCSLLIKKNVKDRNNEIKYDRDSKSISIRDDWLADYDEDNSYEDDICHGFEDDRVLKSISVYDDQFEGYYENYPYKFDKYCSADHEIKEILKLYGSGEIEEILKYQRCRCYTCKKNLTYTTQNIYCHD
jgi:hypothetical protein